MKKLIFVLFLGFCLTLMSYAVSKYKQTNIQGKKELVAQEKVMIKKIKDNFLNH